MLTKVILEKSDLDFQPQINSDSDTDEATPPKRGRTSESSKSFLDLKNDYIFPLCILASLSIGGGHDGSWGFY